ncbi:MAG: hypothetical protein QOE06_3270 [Thermoleophilaceae bacterium]|nr:hypothetical protein [Thermoleophilaceae bacterium]
MPAAVRMLAALPVAVHVHHHFHGVAGGYVGLGAAALVSWAGVPGPGEAALVAAAILASRGRLDLLEVILVAWAGATLGGMGGWLVGLKGGRPVVTARGPFRRARMKTLERGERLYENHPTVAILFTPSWMAGIARLRWTRYLPANAVAALVWASAFALGAYLAGPPIVDVIDDVGLAGLLIVVAIVGGGAAFEAFRRRRE